MLVETLSMKTRTYSELIQHGSFEERFDYLRLGGGVGRATFDFDRYLNQMFYGSREWKRIRTHLLVRDEGRDLGVPGREIYIGPLVHHMNPMTPEDIVHGEEWILDPEFLITTTHLTHNAIHYGVKDLIPPPVVERTPNDTKLW
jgi:hypothetical protein